MKPGDIAVVTKSCNLWAVNPHIGGTEKIDQRIGRLDDGETVFMIQVFGDWTVLQMAYVLAGDKLGYVYTTFLRVID